MLAVAAQLFAAVPARAADDAGTTGLLGALGIEAVSGDTKLADHGGEIEGWLLASKYLDTVGAQIVQRAADSTGEGSRIILLTRDESFSLADASVLDRRIRLLSQRFETFEAGQPACLTPVAKAADADAGAKAAAVKPTTADFAGALRTDTSIGGFDIPLQDRALINAIGHVNPPAGRTHLDLRIPADMTAIPAKDGIVERWDALAVRASKVATACKDDAGGKVLIAQFAAMDTYANTLGDKGASSPLERAAALGDLATGQTPLLLRVALEKAGGTTIARSNIFLKLGVPGAVVISGGIVAGYRLIDPATGALRASGLVECAFPQVNIANVAVYTETMPKTLAVKCNRN